MKSEHTTPLWMRKILCMIFGHDYRLRFVLAKRMDRGRLDGHQYVECTVCEDRP